MSLGIFPSLLYNAMLTCIYLPTETVNGRRNNVVYNKFMYLFLATNEREIVVIGGQKEG